jgi:RNA polymerase sigma factor (TIGR02999 family)
MGAASTPEITHLLHQWRQGDNSAFDRLAEIIYPELHRRARVYMRREGPGHTLQTTALVNEAYLRLANLQKLDWHDRVHFFAVAARVMRRILVDAARARARRGSEAAEIELEQLPDGAGLRARDLIAIDESLTALANLDPRKARVIELRFFGGLSIEETAGVLSISPQSVKRDWTMARAWIMRQLRNNL